MDADNYLFLINKEKIVKAGRMLFAILVIGSWLPGAADAGQGMAWERIAHALHLNADQVHDLRAAEEAMFLEIHRIEAAVHAQELGREEAHAKIKAAREILEVAWQETLSEEQKARWRQLQQDAPQTDRAPQSDRAPQTDRAPQSDRASDALPLWQRIGRVMDLTADQVHLLEAAEAAFLRKMHRIEAAAHDGGLGREEARGHIQEARAALDLALQEILTEGQLARLQEVYGQDRDTGNIVDGLVIPPDDTGSTAPTAVQEQSWGQIKKEMEN